VQDRKSLLAKDRRSTTVPRNQPEVIFFFRVSSLQFIENLKRTFGGKLDPFFQVRC